MRIKGGAVNPGLGSLTPVNINTSSDLATLAAGHINTL